MKPNENFKEFERNDYFTAEIHQFSRNLVVGKFLKRKKVGELQIHIDAIISYKNLKTGRYRTEFERKFKKLKKLTKQEATARLL